MIDEMTNDALVSFVTTSEEVSEIELELADRLRTAVDEINQLVARVRLLEELNGNNT